VKHTANAPHRHFEGIGRNLGERGFEPLSVGRRANVNRNRAVALKHQPGVLARAGGAAFEITPDRRAV